MHDPLGGYLLFNAFDSKFVIIDVTEKESYQHELHWI